MLPVRGKNVGLKQRERCTVLLSYSLRSCGQRVARRILRVVCQWAKPGSEPSHCGNLSLDWRMRCSKACIHSAPGMVGGPSHARKFSAVDPGARQADAPARVEPRHAALHPLLRPRAVASQRRRSGRRGVASERHPVPIGGCAEPVGCCCDAALSTAGPPERLRRSSWRPQICSVPMPQKRCVVRISGAAFYNSSRRCRLRAFAVLKGNPTDQDAQTCQKSNRNNPTT